MNARCGACWQWVKVFEDNTYRAHSLDKGAAVLIMCPGSHREVGTMQRHSPCHRCGRAVPLREDGTHRAHYTGPTLCT